MPDASNPYASAREKLRLLVRLFAVAQSEAERDRLMRDIERLVVHLAEAMASANDQADPVAANHDHDLDLTGET